MTLLDREIMAFSICSVLSDLSPGDTDVTGDLSRGLLDPRTVTCKGWVRITRKASIESLSKVSNITPETLPEKTLSRSERRVRIFAKYLALVQLFLIPIMVTLGDFAIRGADLFGMSFLKLKYPPGEIDHNQFWKALAISLTCSLGYYAFRIWHNPRRNREWIHPILAISFSGSLSFLFFFFYYYTLSLAIGFIFLVTILIITLVFWWSGKEVD